MQGWVEIDLEDLQSTAFELASTFLEIENLIDNTLLKFKKV